ncbi:hypothetical protein [Telluria aromaticivorans]|uniref:Uncharacterized protein n=1 Tax=Telluria aromaticivorans TaxID=2725995 RepID=A0A7Y2K2M9_9BURK|nr:hypothetical protein [Telluria aromaticivorans]NNG25547.1 hypothetical protein [Telluria aromaticivorans]
MSFILVKHLPRAVLAYAVVALPPLASATESNALPAPEQLSLTTATNLSAVAAELERQHKAVLGMVANRTDALVDLHRLAATAQKEADRNLLVLTNTRAAGLSGFIASITKHGDATAEAPAQLEAMEAAVRAELATITAVPAVATAKMQAAAKKLAGLSKQQSDADRLSEWRTFYKDTKTATEALHTEGEKTSAKADNASEKSTSDLLTSEPPPANVK